MVRVPGVPLYLTDINCRCIDPNNINQRILNPAAWQDVAPARSAPAPAITTIIADLIRSAKT